jgi:hypothetical protein
MIAFAQWPANKWRREGIKHGKKLLGSGAVNLATMGLGCIAVLRVPRVHRQVGD